MQPLHKSYVYTVAIQLRDLRMLKDLLPITWTWGKKKKKIGDAKYNSVARSTYAEPVCDAVSTPC